MAVWDDMDMRTPIRVFDKRLEAPERQASGDSFMSFKTLVVDGGIFAPKIGMNHPLEEECNHFLDCVENGGVPRSDARHGLRVVSVLEAATKSMQSDGLTARVTYDFPLSLVSSGPS
jgi:predicted dehydrogenase